MNYANRITNVTTDSFVLTFAINEMVKYCNFGKLYSNELINKITELCQAPVLKGMNFYISEVGNYLFPHLKEDPLPTLDRSTFAFPSSGLRLDASENIVSVKIKYIGKGTTYFETMTKGLIEKEYAIIPRLAIKTKNNGLQYLAPFSAEEEREKGELKLLGFDFYHKVTTLDIPAPIESAESIIERANEIFKEEGKGWCNTDYPTPPFSPEPVKVPKPFYDGVRLDDPSKYRMTFHDIQDGIALLSLNQGPIAHPTLVGGPPGYVPDLFNYGGNDRRISSEPNYQKDQGLNSDTTCFE